MATCSCGQSHMDEFGIWQIGCTGFVPEEDDLFCTYCGDKLLPTGKVESQAEQARRAAALDRVRLDKLAYVDVRAEHGSCKPRHVWLAVSMRTGNEVARVPVQPSYKRTLRALADAIPDPHQHETEEE